ncbi:MAG: helix-turn-helix domain-containing protein [Planctomycetota bacterium]|jgi:IclR family acetate operon transcriptional repressor|nr:helix-turn-helix domain-containing protein [Planctomycetota bacterium]
MSESLPPVARSLRVLEACARADAVSFQDCQDLLAVPPSTVTRLLKALVAEGALEHGDDRLYRLGARMRTLATHILASASLADLAAPILAKLARQCGESAALVMPDGDAFPQIAAKHELPERFGYAPVGHRNRSVHAHGLCRLLLAYLPRVVAASLLTEVTDASTAARVLDDLPRLREAGHLVSLHDDQPGIARVAAAVMAGGQCAAVIGVTGIAASWDAPRQRYLLTAVRTAAADLAALIAKDDL